jgi:hypothetical protein
VASIHGAAAAMRSGGRHPLERAALVLGATAATCDAGEDAAALVHGPAAAEARRLRQKRRRRGREGGEETVEAEAWWRS